MTSIVKSVTDAYYDILENKSDPRVKDWILMGSPWPTIGITVAYLYFCLKLGPAIMKDRKPLQLKPVLFVYNIFQSAFSFYLFREACVCGWVTFYSYRCQPVDYSYSPLAMRTAFGVYLFYVSKLIDLCDTVFFVLRKKDSQMTLLHLVHHTSMPILMWVGTKYVAGGHSTFFGLLNTFIHTVMYFYYLVASLGPQFQKYLWWKKYLTICQMAQFVLVMLHNLQLFFIDCDYPRVFSWMLIGGTALFLTMWINYYRMTYKKHNQKSSVRAKSKVEDLQEEFIVSDVSQRLCFQRKVAKVVMNGQ